ncbi:MAG: DUF3604 domain-containing protein [Myxococcota bacterium]
MRALRIVVVGLLIALGLALVVLHALGRGAFGRFDSDTWEPVAATRPLSAAARAGGRQILFGDLHVHTTISFDAFMLNLPLLGGEGAAPPADACDFARHCAALDFWSINDHAANIQARDWQNTIDGIRACNDLAGDPANPDTVAFLGWEWTQAGATPDTHYGHKNVVLAHTDDARIPARPIAASAGGTASNPPPTLARGLLALDGPRFRDLAARWTALSGTPVCPEAPVRDLPADCREIAETPVELFRKLDDWGHDAIVIPHGTTWGIYSPPLASWDKQLAGAMHDPERQTLVEVYSGHGSAEVYRDWRAALPAADGSLACPPPRPDFEPMCERAGRIVRERCLAEGSPARECAEREARARHHAANAGLSPHVTVAGTSGADWRDAGQCRDCGQPAFKYRPAGSAQYIAALGHFRAGEPPRRFRLGFIASSDIHSARPGTGYKELRALSESPDRVRPEGGIAGAFFTAEPRPAESRSRPYAEASRGLTGLQLYETERSRSFLYTGGLVAVHAQGRDRAAVWDALQRREVYGTSGPRILLWFDWLKEGGTRPMGSEGATREAPVFRVRAVGSRVQAPGCPDRVTRALGAERTARLCAGECHNPGDTRRRIERIEVVRIRPQQAPGEDPASLIDDPWRSVACAGQADGCVATFLDPEFPEARRDTVYYARVFEEPAPTVNGDPLQCARDAAGACLESHPCLDGQDCLAPYAQRAWSSPIYVDYDREGELRE